MKNHWMLAFSAVAIVLIIGCGGGGATTPLLTNPTVAATLTSTTSALTPAAATPELITEETKGPPSISGQDNTGTLEIRVTDQPTDAVSSILVTVENIEVHSSGGQGNSGWQTVVEGPHQFDLMQLMGIEDVLGSTPLEPGRYQQIRFDVVDAVITVRGNLRQARVPSGKIRLVGGFEVTAGVTTIVTMDMDAEKSVVFRPGQGPHLVPVVKLLVRKEGQPLSEAVVASSENPDDESASAETTMTPSQASDGDESTVRVAITTNDNLQFMSFWTAVGAGIL